MTRWTSRLLLLIFVCHASGAVAETQDLEALRKAVADFAHGQAAKLPGEVEIEVAPLDERLQLSACPGLQPYLPAGTRLWGRSSIGVRCQKPESWSIIVPVTVKVMGEALYTARPLARGEALTDQDVTAQRTDLAQLPAGVLTDRSQAVGRIPNVSVAAGLPLRAEMLRGAHVVTLGQNVRIVFTGDGFKVSSEGRALGNAALGETVQVRSASGKVVKGQASAAGVVEVK
jgi:flagellar basal body P-ring formation protein FlgA